MESHRRPAAFEAGTTIDAIQDATAHGGRSGRLRQDRSGRRWVALSIISRGYYVIMYCVRISPQCMCRGGQQYSGVGSLESGVWSLASGTTNHRVARGDWRSCRRLRASPQPMSTLAVGREPGAPLPFLTQPVPHCMTIHVVESPPAFPNWLQPPSDLHSRCCPIRTCTD